MTSKRAATIAHGTLLGYAARRAAALLPALLLPACVFGNNTAAPSGGKPMDPKEAEARFQKMMARENGPFSKHKLELLDGTCAGEIEGATPPKPECKKEDGAGLCTFDVDLGKDEDGDPSNIECGVTTKFEAFGPTVKGLLKEAQLLETPLVEVKPLGEGIATSFVANLSVEIQGSVKVGTMKIATLYAHGYMASCFDIGAGGRKTFARVVEDYFTGMKFKDVPDRPTTFAFGYKRRSGDRTVGFRYGFVMNLPGADGGFVESETAFNLDTDGKKWTVIDIGVETVRDVKGAMESMHEFVWSDGKGPVVLSAKPSEGGKFRLKIEAGEKTNALESTPKAPFTTELSSAPDLVKVSTGGAPSFRYAMLGVSDDDPAFRYVTLTRSKPGVLLEQVEGDKSHKAASADVQPKDELEVDARGIVTKQVSPDAVTELVYSWGTWPRAAGGKAAPPPKKK